MRKTILVFALIGLTAISCKKEEKPWQVVQTIDLAGVKPIGIASHKDGFVISDGDNNRLVYLDKDGNQTGNMQGFDRPMHLISHDERLYIPEYGSDTITVIKEDVKTTMPLKVKLNAPSGIAIEDGFTAIADFYSHSVIYNDGSGWKKLGEKGRGTGEFHYPTDVALAHNKLYVADAYNHRVQVFDLKGNHLQTIGESEKMNASTGIHVSDNEVIIGDFENHQMHVYSLDGILKQTIKDLDKPVDMIVKDDVLYVVNYEGSSLSILKRI